MHKDCFHVLEELEDGSPNVTLIVRSDTGEEIYHLTPELVELMKTEGPEVILAEIDAWEAQTPEEH